MKKLRTAAIVLGVIIIVLIGILFFYSPAKGPTIPVGNVTSTTGTTGTAQ